MLFASTSQAQNRRELGIQKATALQNTDGEQCRDLRPGEKRTVFDDPAKSRPTAGRRYEIYKPSKADSIDADYVIDLTVKFEPSFGYDGAHSDELKASLKDAGFDTDRFFNVKTAGDLIEFLKSVGIKTEGLTVSDVFLKYRYNRLSSYDFLSAKVKEAFQKINRATLERVQTCVDQATRSKPLIDKCGRKLAIRLKAETSDSASSQKMVNSISVSGTHRAVGARGTSLSYHSDWPCGVYVHELLHLTGLPDEYAELVGLFPRPEPKFSGMDNPVNEDWRKCVVTGPPTSIMRNSWAWEKQDAPPLMPAHFDAIAYPDCESKNKLYYQCAGRSKIEMESTKNCSLPEDCTKGHKWLGSCR